MRFYHRHYLDTEEYDGKRRQLFQVTRVTKNAVYYRPVYRTGELGAPHWSRPEEFSLYMLEPA